MIFTPIRRNRLKCGRHYNIAFNPFSGGSFMKTIINVYILLCMMSLAGCGEGETVPKISGVAAGTILTYNGSSWASPASGTTNQLNNVTFGNGLFVAVGSSGTILTSPDGSTWTSQNSGTPLDLYCVTFGNGQFVAVGDLGIVLNSTNGSTWTGHASANLTAPPLNGVTFANGLFVAVGYMGIQYSSDGVTWTTINTLPFGPTGPTVDLYNVTYGNGLFVAVGT